VAQRSLRVATAWQEGEEKAAEVMAVATALTPADLAKIYLESVAWVHESYQG
jgi:hypothetical protein